MDVQKIRKDFPNLNVSVNGNPLIYFDNAASTLKPQSVIDAVSNHYTNYTSNVHRGVHSLSQQATTAYEGARDKIQTFLNAPKRENIIFTKGTTDGINLVAHGFGRKFLKAGDEILISHMEHHSNIVPWQMLCEEIRCVLRVAPINDEGELIIEEFDKLLSDKTKLVSIVHASNSLGTINPIEKIISAAHVKNIPVLIDAAQSITHSAIDVQQLDCDFLVFSGHKLFGPTGTGVLYGKENLLNDMQPYQGGGDMIEVVSFDGTTWNDLPYKFEAGTPNIAGFIGLGAAVDYVQSIGVDAIGKHKEELLVYATEKLCTIDGLRIIGTAAHKTGVISFVMKGIHAQDIATMLDEQGIAVRTGHHCTMPVMEHFGVTSTSRASFSVYNTKEEVDVFIDTLIKIHSIFN